MARMIEVSNPGDFLGNPQTSSEKFSTNYPGNPEEAPDLGAIAVRYGVPAVASMTPMGPLALAGMAVGGEMVAQQMEKGLHVPTGGEGIQGVLSGAASYAGSKILAPAIDVLGNKVMNVGARILNRILVPKDFYTEAESSTARSLYNLLKQLGSSPTPGQVINTDFAQFIEGVSRGALFGKGPVKELDKQNAKLLTQHALDYIEAHAKLGFEPNPFDQNGMLTEMSRSRFGQIVEGILTGKLKMSQIVNARNYETFRQTIAGEGLEVEAKKIFDILKEQASNPNMQSVQGGIQAWLKPVKEYFPDGQGGLVEQATTRITAEDAVEVLRQLNTFQKGSKGERWAAGQIRETLKPELKMTLQNTPGALESYEKAQTVFSNFAQNLDNDLISGVLKTIRRSPSSAIQTIEGSSGRKFDTLMGIKKAFQTSSEGTPTGSLMGYQQNVIEPYRYHVLQRSMTEQGSLDGAVLVKRLDSMGKELGEEVFGGPQGLQSMYNLGEAAKLQAESQASGGRTMYIKMAQGSMLAGAGLGAWSIANDNTAAKLTATGLFVAPVLLSRYIVGNPKLTQAVIDGMTASVGSKALNHATAQIMALSGKDVDLSESLKAFYNGPIPQGLGERAPEGVEQSLQFIPEDTMERELQRQAAAVQVGETGMPIGP